MLDLFPDSFRGVSGVLIKNAESLETMEEVNSLVIDKTGTLTWVG